jgi:hypothetical protein
MGTCTRKDISCIYGCGHRFEIKAEDSNNPHHLKCYCEKCGHFIGYVAATKKNCRVAYVGGLTDKQLEFEFMRDGTEKEMRKRI